jgi:hypothetical protein
MFFIRMFAVFFARTKPAVNMANPACMKNTSDPAISNHAESSAVTRSATVSSVVGSCAIAEENNAIARRKPPSTPSGLCNLPFLIH